jgi:MFS family permease
MSGDGSSDHAPRDDLKPGREIAIYFALVALYFFAFGLQMVVYPSLVTFTLHEDARRVGQAQMALSAPMFALLLFGGLLAERVRAGNALFGLQVAFALPPLALAFAAVNGAVTFSMVIAYGVVMGSLAAFMLPVRDAALNGVVGRELARGGKVVLARAAATATAVQLGAQIAGLLSGAQAGLNPAPFLVLQSAAVAIAAVLSLRLRAPKPEVHARTIADAFRGIGDGLKYSFRDPTMGPMLATAAYIGVFIIGSFQVLFPLIVRDVYGGDAEEVGHLLAIFFGASFVSAVAVGALRPMRWPGRALLMSHLMAAAILASFAIDKPMWAFMTSVAVWGLGAGVTMSTSRTIVQSTASPAYLGRVLAVYSMGFMGGAPIGAWIIGQAIFYLGPSQAALVPAAGLAIAAISLAVFSPIWRMQRDA